jgi:hypothetical protein
VRVELAARQWVGFIVNETVLIAIDGRIDTEGENLD